MRNAAILPALALLAGCAERQAGTGADARVADRVAAETAAAEDPRILVACPEATNYAPPDWPLEPGDVVTDRQKRGLIVKHASQWGLAVVWVASESGLGGAIPFGAGFVDLDTRASQYVGHLPLVPWGNYTLAAELPEALQGVVDAGVDRFDGAAIADRIGDRIRAAFGVGVVANEYAHVYANRKVVEWVEGYIDDPAYPEPPMRSERLERVEKYAPGRPVLEVVREERSRWYGEGVSW